MKEKLLLVISALVCSVTMWAQTGYTFKAVALNVDGLPEKISNVTVNEGAPAETGATAICNYLATSGWDIVAMSEDFDYHNYIAAAPASNFYNFGTWRGYIDLGVSDIIMKNSADTDGLGLALAKYLTYSGENIVAWGNYNGYTDQGADGLIDKGYRSYQVKFGEGAYVNVFILHMDADSNDDDITARETQLGKLATAIKTLMASNKYPTIVLGDTNCRYTRENLKTLFIDAINADSRFTAKDAWVELVYNGEYPTYGGESMMTHALGMQKGEVVDKVFYINTTESNLTLKANSYLHDDGLTVSDHYPVVVSFTLTDPDGTPADNTLEGADEDVVLTDSEPTAVSTDIAGTYYLKNVNSGLFFKSAGNYGSYTSEGVHGIPVTFTKEGESTYSITTTLGAAFYLGDNYYLDNGTKAIWTVKEITRSDGVKKYMICHPNGSDALASFGNGNAGGATYNAADTKQHWILYDTAGEMIKEEMAATISGTTYNASTLIPYGRVDTHHADSRKSLWNGSPSFSGWSNTDNHSMEKFSDAVSQAFDVYQSITDLPNGTYTLTVQAFHRDGYNGTTSTTVNPVLYAGSVSTPICSINAASSPTTKPNSMHEAGNAFKEGYYAVTLSGVEVTDGTLTIGIKNESTSTTCCWTCFNNFQLLYHGTNQGDLKATELYKSIKTAVDEANALVATLSPEAQAAYDISAVKYRYNNDLVSADGALELAMIKEAVQVAVKAQTSSSADENGLVDMTLAITNNSFELGNLSGWTVATASDTGVKTNTGDYTISSGESVDGLYLFNTWAGGDADDCSPLTQSVPGLKNGYYKLKALVTSFAGKTVYLIGNKQIAGTNAFANQSQFVELEVDFLVEDGTADIATVGSWEGKFNYPKGAFFKADNYRLYYQGTVGQGRYEIALSDAKKKAETLNATAKAQFDTQIASYEGLTISGDGKTEATAIYNILKAATKAQVTANSEMTWLIENPNFETGDWTGWTVSTQWDTRVGHQSSDIYANGSQGLYLFNTWNDWVDADNAGVNNPIKQTITGLPKGTYRLTAAVTSDGGNKVFVFANDTAGEGFTATANNTLGDTYVDFEVTDGTATIGAVGARDGVYNAEGGCWYKAANFRLTYLGRELVLNEGETASFEDGFYTSVTLNRTVPEGKWCTIVFPFDIPDVGEWEVMKLIRSEVIKNVASMTFEGVSEVEAGVPYVVRQYLGSDVTQFSMTNIEVTSTLKPIAEGVVTFQPSYTVGTVPVGAFFLNNNTFYQAADATNTLKAFRGYFTVDESAAVNGLQFIIDGEETAIEGVNAETTEEIVAIYSLDGRRVESLVKGVNIVKLSNGKTRKVIVK